MNKRRLRMSDDIASCGSMVVQFVEKHGSQFFIVTKVEELERMALFVLWQRWHEGWYAINAKDAPAKPKYTVEQIKNKQLGISALEEWTQYKKSSDVFDRSLDFNRQAKDALKKRDGWLAWELLWIRQSYEYEKCELIYPVLAVVLPEGSLLG